MPSSLELSEFNTKDTGYRRLNARAFRDSLADIVEHIERTKERLIITRHGKDRVALVAIEDLWMLDSLIKASRSSAVLPPPLQPDWAVFLDVDGTILELAANPDLLVVPPQLPTILCQVADQQGGALALLSGKPIAALDALLKPWCGAVAGLHGAERRRGDGTVDVAGAADTDAKDALARIKPALVNFAAQFPGVWIEDSGRAIGLHYRSAPHLSGQIRQLATDLLKEHGDVIQAVAGKSFMDFRPCFLGKEAAIASFMQEAPFTRRRPVYLGDHLMDEGVFAAVNRQAGITIRVGAPLAMTAAQYTLPSVDAVLEWLSGR